MATSDIKKRLIAKINATDNDELLDDIFRWMELKEETKPAYIFTEEEDKEIGNIVSDIEKGNYLTRKEADEQAKKWLRK